MDRALSVSVRQSLDVARKLRRLVQANDALVGTAEALAPLLNQIGALPAGARAKLVEVLEALGIDSADFAVIVAALGVIRQSIEGTLTRQQP